MFILFIINFKQKFVNKIFAKTYKLFLIFRLGLSKYAKLKIKINIGTTQHNIINYATELNFKRNNA